MLNGELFGTLLEAQVLVERWRRHYSQVRPHTALSQRPPARAAGAMGGGPSLTGVTTTGVRSIADLHLRGASPMPLGMAFGLTGDTRA